MCILTNAPCNIYNIYNTKIYTSLIWTRDFSGLFFIASPQYLQYIKII